VLALTPARRLVDELMHHARQAPTLPLSRTFLIPDLVDARAAMRQPPSWMAVFMKAYGLAARSFPELRRAYIPYPYARLYEHPHTNCAVLVERQWQGETIVLAAKVRAPEAMPLAEVDGHLKSFREDDVWSISPFRQLLRVARLPWLLRRFVFWSTLYWSGFKRAKRFGTCMMSSLGALGVEQGHPLTPLTTYFTFGPVGPGGEVTAKIVYDHRVMDGRTVARALMHLEEILKTALFQEVRQMRRPQLKLSFSDVG
jgi:pyruvate/2-oxoglutarate dehydrogenase complex dihydrolipoamide acyltransferase (E2) component